MKAGGHAPSPTPKRGPQLGTLPGLPPRSPGSQGLSKAPGNSAPGLRATAGEDLWGAHPVLLLRPQLPHALQQPGLGPVQVGSEACDGDGVRLQLRCWDVDVHLVDTGQTRCVWGPRMGVCPSGPTDDGKLESRTACLSHLPGTHLQAGDKEDGQQSSQRRAGGGHLLGGGGGSPGDSSLPAPGLPGQDPHTAHLEFVHHLADPAALLPNDVPVEVEGHLHLSGDRDQGLRGRGTTSGLRAVIRVTLGLSTGRTTVCTRNLPRCSI